MEVTSPAPTTVICPACNAQVGNPCTQPDDRSRHNVKFFHYARIESAQKGGPQEPEHDEELQEILDTTSIEAEQEKILEIPEELQPGRQWDTRGEFDVHLPCGMVHIPGHRALHEAVCPSITQKLTVEQLQELRKPPTKTTREENEERLIAWAISRHKRTYNRERSPFERGQDDRARDLLAALGLKPFSVYSEGYAATGEHGGATSHGTHWGRDFNDAIERWKREDHSAARYLSKRTNSLGHVTWTYWGCKLFDNLHDAQKSFG